MRRIKCYMCQNFSAAILLSLARETYGSVVKGGVIAIISVGDHPFHCGFCVLVRTVRRFLPRLPIAYHETVMVKL